MTTAPPAIYSDGWIRRLCRDGAATDWKALEARLLDAARRDRAGSNEVDGHKTSHAAGGGAGGGAKLRVTASDDPEVGADGEDVPITGTEAQVFALLELRPDPIREHTEAALGYLSDSIHAARALEHQLDRIDSISDPTPPAKRQRLDCCQGACEDRSAPGKAGMCEPCYKWIKREEKRAEREHRDPRTTVPAAVIEAREAGRAKMTGPDAIRADDLADLIDPDSEAADAAVHLAEAIG